MTVLIRCRLAASAWTEWGNPDRAVMPVLAAVAGGKYGSETLVDDLCHAIANAVDSSGEPVPRSRDSDGEPGDVWAVWGRTVIPESSLPLGLGDRPDEGRHQPGALIIATESPQPQPEYDEEGSGEPSVLNVRLRLEQAITSRLADRKLFLDRRRDVRRILSGLSGTIGEGRVNRIK